MVAKPIRRNKLLEFFASLPRCLVGFEASGSAHHWARELIKLGHDARMMPPAYVKPYIRRRRKTRRMQRRICEAVTRPSMRFVGVRSLENQAALMRHKAREMWSLSEHNGNGLRGHLTEVGVIAAQGRHTRELAELIEACDGRCQGNGGSSTCSATAISRAATMPRGRATRPRQQSVSACRLAS